MNFLFFVLAIICFALVMLDTVVIGLGGIRLLAAGLLCMCLAGLAPLVEPIILKRP